MSATPVPAPASPGPWEVPEPLPGSRLPDARRDLPETRGRTAGVQPRPPCPVWLAPPQLPPWPVVWFGVEGSAGGRAPDLAVHLWGLAVDDGERLPVPEAIRAGFEDRGGRCAWERFVARAGEILEQHPEARWVHCSPDERSTVRAYAAACGAPAGFLARLEEALFELLSRGVRRALYVPPDRCSIRQLAHGAGFRWRAPVPEPAGPLDRYRRARAGTDPAERERILRGIADSNAEHLLAMRAVWRWMLERGPREYCG